MPRICITIPAKTPQPYRFPLDTEVVTIGRSAANDVVIDHGSVSSRHCEMRRVPGGFILADLDSTNGIHLDEEEMEVIDLKDGMDAEVGDVLFNYQLTEEEQDELGSEKFKPHQKKKKKKKAVATPPPARPPMPQSSPTLVASKSDNGAQEFIIFLIFAILAIFAFCFGLNSAHRASIPADERSGRSLLKDMSASSEDGK
ncbi:FHA domain-containing protein [Roseibacillus persicicus]|uniref:FHA domain-containing protein n=1 Tax=Roseibacillus persicicus TaxID=454148 RepID=A0A918TSK4_9BACT|nr:FHA domain-containing protein [Roseibacillus persicicus]GHC59120.1 hypothetical protein GCM10007100_27750 [Roseibacillus persicicus]